MPISVPRRAVALLASATLVAGASIALAGAASALPSAPVPVSPGYGDAGPTNPVLDWDAAAGAMRYRVQVAATSTFSSLLYSADTYATAATPPTDLPLGNLYWRVAALDAAGTLSPYSSTLLFTKTAAGGPTPLSPTDGAELTYPNDAPVLTW